MVDECSYKINGGRGEDGEKNHHKDKKIEDPGGQIFEFFATNKFTTVKNALQ